MNIERHGVSTGGYRSHGTACGTVRDRSIRTPPIRADAGASRKYGVYTVCYQEERLRTSPCRYSCSILRLESRVGETPTHRPRALVALVYSTSAFWYKFCDVTSNYSAKLIIKTCRIFRRYTVAKVTGTR